MKEKHVVTLGFSKDNMKISSTLSIQQPHGHSNKATPQKTKWAK